MESDIVTLARLFISEGQDKFIYINYKDAIQIKWIDFINNFADNSRGAMIRINNGTESLITAYRGGDDSWYVII